MTILHACHICKETLRNTKGIKCSYCQNIAHLSCDKLEEEDLDKILFYYCTQCRDDVGWELEWATEEATVQQKKSKEDHYEVEQILQHRGEEPNRQFLVKWLGYDTKFNMWLDEDELTSAYKLLQDYCRASGIALSKIVGLFGSTGPTPNRSNFVNIEQILHEVKKLCKSDIPVDYYEDDYQFLGDKGIVLVGYEAHLYVVGKDNDNYFVADGDNLFLNNVHTRNYLRSLFKVKMTGVKFDQQIAASHCGSSAVLIVKAMSTALQTKDWPTFLKVGKRQRERLVNKFHPNKCQTVRVNNLPGWLVCPNCGNYKSRSLRTIKCHEKKCTSTEPKN